jgi:hypothetical protein
MVGHEQLFFQNLLGLINKASLYVLTIFRQIWLQFSQKRQFSVIRWLGMSNCFFSRIVRFNKQ